MAKGQHLSRYQKGIVNRYYEHQDTILLNRLSEIVSELYLAEGKAADRLWKRAATALEASKMETKRFAAVVEKRDVEGLARVVGDMHGKS